MQIAGGAGAALELPARPVPGENVALRTAGTIWIILLAVTVALPAAERAPQVQDLSTRELAQGQYSRMHMLLEKTIFAVDVLTVDMRFDPETRDRFERLARQQTYSEELASRITAAALDAQHALVTLQFERSVPFDRWLQEARRGLSQAAQGNLIPQETSREVRGSLPRWFAPVEERGFRKGDRIVYRIDPDLLRTRLVSEAGTVLIDHTDPGASPGRAVLAGFLAPGTDFREPLVRSLIAEPIGRTARLAAPTGQRP